MPLTSAETFGDLLRQHRLAAGLTQEALAERAGLSVHGIQKLERGATHPYRDTAQRLAAALQLEPDAQVRFRDAVQPVRRHATLRSVSAPGTASHNLPLALSSFIGREREQAEVRARLAGARLLTLTGVGGCGKTRLALEVARDVVPNCPDGVWLVELGPLADPEMVAQRVAAVLDVRESPDQPLVAALVSALASRRLLLVLDNCEHVLHACAVLIDRVLRTCPHVQVLATSREPIGISGEVAWRVPSLTVPDPRRVASVAELAQNPAVQLFVERASAAMARFALSERNATAVAQVCQRLDGIPLALELAAARLEALSAEQLAARLDQRFLLLTGGSRTALPRQQTLGATLDWSYDLLNKSERRLFARLAVFASVWTLEAAEAVCGGAGLVSESVLDLLARLVRKSLVVASEAADGAERYELLESVRDYARQKLLTRGKAETTATRERHAAYYSALADRLHPAMEVTPGWLSGDSAQMAVRHQFEEAQDDMRAALAWWLDHRRPVEGLTLAVTFGQFLDWCGLYGEARHWLEAMLELASPTPSYMGGPDHVVTTTPAPLRWRALFLVGLMTHYQGEYAQACPFLEASDAISREDDNAPGRYAMPQLGLDLWLAGDAGRARSVLDESLRHGRESGDSLLLTVTLRHLGIVARFEGEYERAAALLRESVAHIKPGAFQGGFSTARGLSNLGRVMYLQGNVGQARSLLSQAFEAIQESRLAGQALADALEWLAAVDAARGELIRAATLFGAAEAQWRTTGAARYSPDRSAYEREVASLRAALGAETLGLAWTEGQAMSAEQAVEYALA